MKMLKGGELYVNVLSWAQIIVGSVLILFIVYLVSAYPPDMFNALTELSRFDPRPIDIMGEMFNPLTMPVFNIPAKTDYHLGIPFLCGLLFIISGIGLRCYNEVVYISSLIFMLVLTVLPIKWSYRIIDSSLGQLQYVRQGMYQDFSDMWIVFWCGLYLIYTLCFFLCFLKPDVRIKYCSKK